MSVLMVLETQQLNRDNIDLRNKIEKLIKKHDKLKGKNIVLSTIQKDKIRELTVLQVHDILEPVYPSEMNKIIMKYY
jgi:low affinity Fe/Cu permease